MANREHKAYPNIREIPFYSPGAGELYVLLMEDRSRHPLNRDDDPTNNSNL
ncbi:hypothetical protein Pla52o_46740 [Novipirellula galeiformis]|uniref:Uncharacterized protein n=1 Tax=Novipirellula galeiformis TaxID=2528004 RepID=A0A5C6C6B1_9BACT|nr:hypothetical protein Pla52o_46740 [Novipirellula galeiformis]